MNKEKFIELYKSLNEETIDSLYEFSCLKASGFDDEIAYKNISTLHTMWLKDNACRCISQLSDDLYELSQNEDIDDLSVREILEMI